MAMESFHRGNATTERARSGGAAAPGGKGIKKKRPRLGKVAESFQSRLIASFGVVRRRDLRAGMSPKSSRYLRTFALCWSSVLTRDVVHFWKRYFACQTSFTCTFCANYVSPMCCR